MSRKIKRPRLRFTPTAWAKLLFLRDVADCEVGALGLAAGEDPLTVTDLLVPQQEVSSVTVRFDDRSVADLFEDQVAEGHHPSQFGRIWVHTHPGHSSLPSAVDEATFARVFGGCDWAVMFILARNGQSYARLRFGVGPGGEMRIPVEVDYTVAFEGSDQASWRLEYGEKVRPQARCQGWPLLLPADWAEWEALADLPDPMLAQGGGDHVTG